MNGIKITIENDYKCFDLVIVNFCDVFSCQIDGGSDVLGIEHLIKSRNFRNMVKQLYFNNFNSDHISGFQIAPITWAYDNNKEIEIIKLYVFGELIDLPLNEYHSFVHYLYDYVFNKG